MDFKSFTVDFKQRNDREERHKIVHLEIKTFTMIAWPSYSFKM